MAKAKLVVGAKVKVYRWTKSAEAAYLPERILNSIGIITRGKTDIIYLGVTLEGDTIEWYIPPSCLKRVD